MVKKIIEPGTYIAAGEELASGNGTFNENDEIYSSIFGIDQSTEREAVVSGKSTIKNVRAGDEIYGVILDVMESKSLVIIDPIKKEGERYLPQDIYVIKVSSIDNSYLKSIKDAFRIGDIIKAKVVEFREEIELNTKEPQYGVIKAFCSQCRNTMVLKDRKLTCRNCGSVENRKISDQYLVTV